LRDVGFAGFADDEVVVYECVGDGADDGDEGDEEGPAEAQAAEGEAFVEVVGAGLDGFEDSGIPFGEAWREWALEVLE